MILTEMEKKDFIEIVPKLTERIFEVENESILLYKVLMIFLDKTVNRELQFWELNWSTDVEKIKENFAKCLYIMAEFSTEGSSSSNS